MCRDILLDMVRRDGSFDDFVEALSVTEEGILEVHDWRRFYWWDPWPGKEEEEEYREFEEKEMQKLELELEKLVLSSSSCLVVYWEELYLRVLGQITI